MGERKRLLLVEDNPLFAEQIATAVSVLPQEWTIDLVDEGEQALNLIDRSARGYDLALVDIGLPDISGIAVVRACCQKFSDMPVVVISVIASEHVVLKAIEAGARGYVLKGGSVEEVSQAIAQVMDGIYPLSPALARFLFRKLAHEHEQAAVEDPSMRDFRLTPRELETLRHLSQGLSYENVAMEMGVALSTIQSNVRSLYRKLNVRSQVQAILKARAHDLI